MTTRRGLFRALASVSILTTAAALAAGTLPSAASAAAGRAAHSAPSSASVTAAAARGQSGPAARRALGQVAASAIAPSHPSTAPGAATGAISGIVRNPGGAALPGACVTATGPAGSVTSRAHSGGRYVLAGLLPGSYTVSYRDCAQPSKYLQQRYGSAGLTGGATHVTVRAGQATPLTPVTLRAASPAAEVAATRQLVRARLAALNAAGSGGVISGTARNRAGKRLAGICVQANSQTKNSSTTWFTATGRHGGYSLPVGTSGKWTVQFQGGCGGKGNYAPQWWRRASTVRKATKLTERPGRSFHGIGAVLRAGATISGAVTAASSGAALSDVCVAAEGLGAAKGVYGWTVTRANGSYVMKDLGTGRYLMSFQPDCGQTGNYLGLTKTVGPVADGKTSSGINAALRTGAEISGVVTSAADGSPVAKVCVDDQNGDEAVTGADGSYTLTRLRAGNFYLSFTPGCGPGDTSYAPQYYNNVVNGQSATPVHLSPSQARSGINAALQPGGTVTGQVTSRSGAPLAGVCAWLTSRNDAGGLGASPYLQTLVPIVIGGGGFGHTGPKGHFTIRNLLPGQYSVLFTGGCGHGSAKYALQLFTPQGGGQWISVNGGTVTAGVNAALQVGGTMTGTVARSGGKALSGICVSATRTGVPAMQSFVLSYPSTRRDGSYQLTGLATGRYTVQFAPCFSQPYAPQWYKGKSSPASATLVAVRAGHTTRRVSATMISGGTLTGRVRSGITGGPVRNACILVTDSSGVPVAGGLTSASGQYRIRHMPAGRWTLQPAMCLAASPSLAGIVRSGYRVRNARTTTANITLPRGGSLSGTVQGSSPEAAEAGICVEATPLTGHGQPNTAVTGPDGRYELPGLASGKYRVLFTPLCLFGTADVAPQWYDGASSRSAATPVTVTGGQTTTGIGGTLADDGAISGTVTVSGTATAGVCVGAYAGTSATPAVTAITGSDGSYQIAGLPAGSYSVEFTKGCGAASYAAQWYGGATRSAATPVTVTAGATATGIDAS